MECIDGDIASLPELRRVGIDTLVNALGPIGMARFMLQFNSGGQGDYAAERDSILESATVDKLVDEIEHRRKNPLIE